MITFFNFMIPTFLFLIYCYQQLSISKSSPKRYRTRAFYAFLGSALGLITGYALCNFQTSYQDFFSWPNPHPFLGALIGMIIGLSIPFLQGIIKKSFTK